MAFISKLVALCATAFVNVGMAQVVGPTSLHSASGELQFKEAASRAATVLGNLGINPGNKSRMWLSLQDYVRGHREWLVFTEDKSWALALDAKNSTLMSLYFQGRRHQQYEGKGRTGKQFFRTESQARQHLLMLARKLDVPSSAKLTSFAWKKDGEVKDANSYGEVGGVFKDSSGRVVATLNCDPQDGVLVEFSRTRS
jgi:hypothetical protein